MRKGEYYQLSVQDPKHLPVWTSSNKNIAEVDSQGKVHAINVGTTEIKVDAGIVLTCTVTVTMETKPQTEPVLSTGMPEPSGRSGCASKGDACGSYDAAGSI